VVLWRYLLAAILVLAAGWWYMLMPRPDPVQDLWSKYEKVKAGMPGPQVEEILGPPQVVEVVFDDFQAWAWRAGRYRLGLGMDRNDPPRVLGKGFTLQEQAGQEGP
jgi:hypothetical protein